MVKSKLVVILLLVIGFAGSLATVVFGVQDELHTQASVGALFAFFFIAAIVKEIRE